MMTWLNDDMDGTNNTSETINRGLKRFSNHGKSLISVFAQFTILRQIAIKMLLKVKKLRKRKSKITAKYDSIMKRLRDFDNVYPDQLIKSLITTLKALGSL